MRLFPNLKYFILFLFGFIFIGSDTIDKSEMKRDECIILLHGLGRTSNSMKSISSYLTDRKYDVFNIDYSSRTQSIELSIQELKIKIEKINVEKYSKTHFVTHSLGGIIVRQYLKDNQLENLGRVVMLSPPSKGTELVNTLRDNFIFQFVTGPAGQQLGVEQTSFPNKLGEVNFDVGIITGNSSLNPLYSSIIPGDDDGCVSVERAKLEGMKDFLVVPHSHTFIMNSKEVKRQVVYFLDNGKFDK